MNALDRIAAWLDRELPAAGFNDSSHNGLQVANSGRVRRVCAGVDASLEFFEAARRRGADLLLCHHGLSWGDSLKRITGLNYRRLQFLIRHDMALYACHLPLDAHPRFGNNILLCRALGLRRIRRFGLYAGTEIGFTGVLPRPLAFGDFKQLVRRAIGPNVQAFACGRKTVRSVAVVSGGAPGELDEAGRKGIDVYLTGESNLHAYNLAREYGINAVFAGHYATEVFGVRALAARLKRRFRLPADLIDLKIPWCPSPPARRLTEWDSAGRRRRPPRGSARGPPGPTRA
jgi:dinuclear metal center YbgI/SA1388 family protein